MRVDVVSLDDGWCVGMGCGIDPPLDAFAIGAFRSGDVYTGWLCEDRDRYLYATCTAAWTPTVPVGSSVECLGYGGMNRPFIISVSCDQT